LRQYSIMPLAQTIACRWMRNVERVYGESGKLVEKYDVLATGRPGGGGEYPLQDGFGWTNGVMRKLMALYPEAVAQTSPSECPVAAATTRAGENESFDLQAARGVVQRLIPGLADNLRLGTLAPQPGSERFRISRTDGRPEIRGSSPSALLAGVNWYLKYVAKFSVTTNGIRIGQLQNLPLPAAPIERKTRATVRYALNENTDGYSTPYWDWPRWEHEIDLLALSGVNAMIIERGSAEVLYQTFREFGYTDQAAREWLTLPAHLNWQLMGNVCCFGGPASRKLMRRQLESARQIISRLRELSITPVLPGFYGIVPADFRRLFPDAHVVPQGEWAGFTRPGWLDPRDPLFARIAASYYRHQHALLGDSDIYDMEVFQEGGTAGHVPVAQGARLVQSALTTAHPRAQWMMLAWEGNPKQELLAGVDRGRLLIIDIDHNRVPRDDRQHDFQGAPFLFGGLWEFGGRTTLGTDLTNITKRLPAMAHANANMAGTALFTEGLDTNPFLFDLFTEMAWHAEPVDATEWTRAYIERRYGAADPHALAAWQILLHTAYDLRVEGIIFNSERDAGQESLFAAEPSLTANRASNWSPEARRYDPIAFQGALAELLAVSPALRHSEGFRYDLVDVARQALANESRQLLPRIATAYHDRNLAAFRTQTARWLELMDLQDALLATHGAFLLGAWLAPVAAWASDPAERAQLEHDARSILTTWGDRHASADARLHDYGNKDWAGLTQGYYRVRWARYFAALDQELVTGTPAEPIDWFAIGDAWNHGAEEYSTQPVGDTYVMAARVARALRIAAAAPLPQLAPRSS
jgi:alpha-N-acetylglucosaminidase